MNTTIASISRAQLDQVHGGKVLTATPEYATGARPVQYSTEQLHHLCTEGLNHPEPGLTPFESCLNNVVRNGINMGGRSGWDGAWRTLVAEELKE
jgi:hypothetical protein